MVYMFLANGFEEIEALYTLDVLRRAGVDIQTVGVSSKTATGSHNIPVICDIGLGMTGILIGGDQVKIGSFQTCPVNTAVSGDGREEGIGSKGNANAHIL